VIEVLFLVIECGTKKVFFRKYRIQKTKWGRQIATVEASTVPRSIDHPGGKVNISMLMIMNADT